MKGGAGLMQLRDSCRFSIGRHEIHCGSQIMEVVPADRLHIQWSPAYG